LEKSITAIVKAKAGLALERKPKSVMCFATSPCFVRGLGREATKSEAGAPPYIFPLHVRAICARSRDSREKWDDALMSTPKAPIAVAVYIKIYTNKDSAASIVPVEKAMSK